MELVSKTGADSLQTTVLDSLFSASDSFSFDDRVRKQSVRRKLNPLFRTENALFHKTNYFLRKWPLAITSTAVFFLTTLCGFIGFNIINQTTMQFAACDTLFALGIFLLPTIIVSTLWIAALHPLSDAGAEIDKNSVVKIYEKLLPFATIFGIEKSWNNVLTIQYTDDTEPGFYSGISAFNAAYFASSMNNSLTQAWRHILLRPASAVAVAGKANVIHPILSSEEFLTGISKRTFG